MFSLIRLTIQRARQERLPQAAGSLAFTTLLSIVPLLAVSFALFTRFPVFHRLEVVIEDVLLKSLLPADISRTVLTTLNRFAANAGGLTWLGSAFLLVTAIALFLTVENALNQMWQVKRNRPFLRRVGLYLLMLGVGPPVLGLSLWATSTVLAASAGLIEVLPASARFVLDLGPLLLGTLTMTGLFWTVPNAPVRLVDALAGGLLAGIAFELGKRGVAAYLVKLPTYRTVYGAFAAFPIFLLWVYFSWLVTLSAAMVAANLARVRRPAPGARARARG